MLIRDFSPGAHIRACVRPEGSLVKAARHASAVWSSMPQNATLINWYKGLSRPTNSMKKEMEVGHSLGASGQNRYSCGTAGNEFIAADHRKTLLTLVILLVISFTFFARAAEGERDVIYGSKEGLNVRLSRDVGTGYNPEIWDGKRKILSRKGDSAWSLAVASGNAVIVKCREHFDHVSYDNKRRTLRLMENVSVSGGLHIRVWETYHFLKSGEIDLRMGIASDERTSVWFSPTYTVADDAQILWIGKDKNDYLHTDRFESPDPQAPPGKKYSPIPVLGVSIEQHSYVLASGSSWDYPLPYYGEPHIIVDGRSLSVPQIGTEDHPILLVPGQRHQWQTIIARISDEVQYNNSAPPDSNRSEYILELGGEIALAHALTAEQRKPNSAVQRSLYEQAISHFDSIALATAYWARITTPTGKLSVTPAAYYSPGTWMRDSFWTVLGLDGLPVEKETEATILSEYTKEIPRTGPFAGRVPLVINAPGTVCFDDESGLYFLIRMYHDVATLKLPVANREIASLVLNYILNHQVRDGRFFAAGPSIFEHYPFSPNGWLDGYGYSRGDVIASNQGIFVVALEAAGRLGITVSPLLLSEAKNEYASLYDNQLGYMRWLGSKEYRSPDALAGEALSLYLFDRPLLSDSVVRKTLQAQVWSKYGMQILATRNMRYVTPNEFLNTTNDGIAEEPPGWYQNGGSWLLWEYLAEYAARRQGSRQACGLMRRSIEFELTATPLLKEFKLTHIDPELDAKVDRDGNRVLGSTDISRQGYGWNAAVRAFRRDLEGRHLACADRPTHIQ